MPVNPDTERRSDNDASLHDQVLWSLQEAGVLDLVLYIIGSEYENQYHLHTLEIICLLYREQVSEIKFVYLVVGLIDITSLGYTYLFYSLVEMSKSYIVILILLFRSKNLVYSLSHDWLFFVGEAGNLSQSSTEDSVSISSVPYKILSSCICDPCLNPNFIFRAGSG